MKVTRTKIQAMLAGCLLAAGLQVQAQDHYPIGVEGIRGATLPPPGIYLRDYNYFYYSDHLNGVSPFEVFAYVQAPRLIWMTELKPLGFNYGMDIIVPFAYSTVKTPGGRNTAFGLADIQVEPLLLSRYFDKFDVAGGYALWIPTGDFKAGHPEKPGKGFYTHMLTLGATWYPDAEKQYAVSLLNRYEFNHEQDDTAITPGQTYSLEASVSRALSKTLEVGVNAYYQQQVTDNSGAGSTAADNTLARVVGLGPEVVGVIPCIGVQASLRYAYEIDAKYRTRGHMACLTLTKRF